MASTGTVLIADDDRNLRRTLSLILRREGYSVTAAADAEEALRCASSGTFDVAFVDLQMPGTDGLALLGQLRKLHPDMPVLILTGHATLDSAIEAVRRGARDYLLKPADPLRIITRVREVLEEEKRPQRQREIVSQVQALSAELQQLTGGDTSLGGLLASMPAAASSRFLRQGILTLDLHARHAMLADRFVPLPSTDFDYLVTLARHAPDPVSHELLVEQTQGYEVSPLGARELVRWRMHQLRQALEPDPRKPRYIITVRGFGYSLAV